MTTSNYGGPPQTGEQQSTSGGGLSEKKEQAQEVAGTATQEAGRVASVTKDEVMNVAAEAKHQAANLMDQALSEVEQQSETQRDRLVETLRGFTDDVEKMLSGQGGANGLAGDLARQVADRARVLTSSLQDRRPGEILEDVRGFARRRPATFLFGALAAGVVAGRLTRGAKDSGAVGSNGTSGSSSTSTSSTPPMTPPMTQPPASAGGYASGAAGGGVGTSPANTGVPPIDDLGDTPLAPDSGFAEPESGLAPPSSGQYGGPA
ncbi:MAG: hypothetical protein ACXVWX_03165 [Nocardioides sp.]